MPTARSQRRIDMDIVADMDFAEMDAEKQYRLMFYAERMAKR